MERVCEREGGNELDSVICIKNIHTNESFEMTLLFLDALRNSNVFTNGMAQRCLA